LVRKEAFINNTYEIEKIERLSRRLPKDFSLWLKNKIMETARPRMPVRKVNKNGPNNPFEIIGAFLSFTQVFQKRTVEKLLFLRQIFLTNAFQEI
jgi:hypothetical protein